MKKVISIKLLPTTEQAESLKKTTALFKDVCNFLSEKAFESKKYNKVILHRLCYQLCKEKFPAFSSQLIVRAIGVVCDSYRLQQKEQTNFTRSTAVYDARILTWRENEASIWTVAGRFHIPIEVWNMDLFNLPKGQSDLICKNNKWFLQTAVTTPEALKIEPIKWLGVDLGIVNLAVTSDGEIFSGEKTANTSRGCSACGYIDKANRKNQSDFVCLKCGFALNADFNAALNISNRAAVNQPIVLSRL